MCVRSTVAGHSDTDFMTPVAWLWCHSNVQQPLDWDLTQNLRELVTGQGSHCNPSTGLEEEEEEESERTGRELSEPVAWAFATGQTVGNMKATKS